MNGRKWLILLLAIVTVMSLATYTGVTRSLFTDDEHSTNDALGIRWGLFTLNEDFEDTVDWDVNWDENGTTTWVQYTSKPHGGIYNAYSDLNSNGYLTTDEIEASTADNITVSFWFNTKSVEAGDLLVQRYNGTSYITWYDITSHPAYVNNAWCEFNEVITDSQYLIAGFRLRFDTTGLVDVNEEANIDDVIIATDTIPPSAPTGLAATPGNEQISLTWASNNETDLWGYNVYRGPTSGNYTQINASVVISSTYTDTPLYGGGTYYYAVKAVDLGNNESGYSDEASDTAVDIAPAVPTGLTANQSEFQMSLDWNDNIETDLEGYNVYRGLTSGNYTKIESLWTSSNYTDTGLTNGITYYYAVTATDNGTYESGDSNEASDTPVDIPPAAPTGLGATPGDEQISLVWDDNTEIDLEGYNIYRGLSSGNYTQIESLWTSSNYTDTPLYGGGTYYYAVKAVDEGTNESGYSDEASDTAVDIAPAAPNGLGATPGDEQISLDWDDNVETDLAGYNIYRGPSSGNYTQIESLWTSSNYTDTGLVFDTYYYVVTAVDAIDPVAYESDNSSEVSATPNDIAPAAPTGLAATPGDFQVSLDWNDNTEPDLAGYNVYRSLTSGDNYTQVNVGLVSTSNYTDTGLTNGTTYYYVVTAVDAADPVAYESGYSSEVSATPAIPPQTLLTDGFEGTPWDANWDGNGTTDWSQTGTYIHNGSWAALGSAGDTYLTTDDLDTSTGDNITISFWFRFKLLKKGPLYVQTYNGSSYITQHDLFVYPGVVAAGTYYKYSESITDSQYLRSDFRLRFDASTVSTDVFIDDVLITMGSYPPDAPTGLTATPGDEQVSLDWNDNTEPDLDGYNIYRSLTSGSGYSKINVSLISTSSYTDNGLTNGVTYYYVVTAVDLGNNESGYSNEDSTTPANAPPAPPTGLAATPGDFQVSLDWNDNTEPDLAGYNVHRSLTSGSGYSKINVSLVTASYYTDTGLSNNTTYYYVVTATDNLTAESGYSNEASTIPNVPPAAPTGLLAIAGDEQVNLDWNDNTEPDLTGYNIYRGLTSGNYTQIESLWTSSNYTDTGLTNDVTYYYVVTATDNVTAESIYSSEANVTPGDPPPAAPTGLAATTGYKRVSLDWADNTEGDLAGYNVYRSLTSGSGYAKINGSLLTSSDYLNTGLSNGVTYYYVVTAVDTLDNESTYSSEDSATTWTPTLWTQTSQADFEAGVSDNVNTTLSSGNVILAAGGDAGGANMTLFWDGDTAPSGWTIVSNIGGDFYQRFPRGEATYGGTSGSANNTHTATFASTSTGNGSVNIATGTNAGTATATHTHTLSSSTISTNSNLPVYRNLKVIKYNSGVPATIPAGAIAIFDTTPPTGWTRYSAQDNYYVRDGATANVTGGSANHTHTVSITTNTPTGTTTLKTGGGIYLRNEYPYPLQDCQYQRCQ
ncbi:fibronectin type III domain-containing protein [Chloroflexota bacterium]